MDGKYWSDRYKEKRTGWDIGYPSGPLKGFIDELDNKGLKILIPGAGNAYEAQYAYEQGFTNTHVVDIAKEPLDALKSRCPSFPESQMILGDFFELEGSYDLVLEQTFFCALDPRMRESYVKKMHELLSPNGALKGVLFNFPLSEKGPPFGGSVEAYQSLFDAHFVIDKMHPCSNSIPERAGNEVSIELTFKGM